MSRTSKKRRDNKKSTNHRFPSLLSAWRKKYEAFTAYLADGSEAQHQKALAATHSWTKSVRHHARSKTLNTAIDAQPCSNQREKSYVVRDALDVVGEWEIVSESGTRVVRLWAIPLTAPVSQLLAIHRQGDALASLVGEMSDTTAVFLTSIPAHIACVVTPQALADLGFAARTALADPAVVEEVRKTLEPYAMPSHCNLDNAQSIGTAVALVASVDSHIALPAFAGKYTPAQSQVWSAGLEQLKGATGADSVFASAPRQWTRGVVLALLTWTDFSWGVNARVAQTERKVIDISKVWVEFQPHGIALNAFADSEAFSTTTLPVEVTVWPWYSMMDAWEERGITLLQNT